MGKYGQILGITIEIEQKIECILIKGSTHVAHDERMNPIYFKVYGPGHGQTLPLLHDVPYHEAYKENCVGKQHIHGPKIYMFI